MARAAATPGHVPGPVLRPQAKDHGAPRGRVTVVPWPVSAGTTTIALGRVEARVEALRHAYALGVYWETERRRRPYSPFE